MCLCSLWSPAGVPLCLQQHTGKGSVAKVLSRQPEYACLACNTQPQFLTHTQSLAQLVQMCCQLHSIITLMTYHVTLQCQNDIARSEVLSANALDWHTGEFICVSGTDGKAVLCTQNGTVLSTLADRGSWVWCVRGHPQKNCVAVGCQDGSIAVYQLVFSTVHSLYNDQYAYRSALQLSGLLCMPHHQSMPCCQPTMP